MKNKKGTILAEYQKATKEQQEGKRNDLQCAKCGLNKFLTVDHIIPVSLLKDFCVLDDYDLRYNHRENYQLLCKFCNTEKADRLDVRNPKTFEILDDIIKRVKEDLK